jgi:hypothetical protein
MNISRKMLLNSAFKLNDIRSQNSLYKMDENNLNLLNKIKILNESFKKIKFKFLFNLLSIVLVLIFLSTKVT